ncbi:MULTISPECIES: sulfurtransferase [unclassified Adlercreutzia]|uniref:sulfurtransferase n=1 Tax=unclassified Adlercreutzia TaxID=2636013 RepID=UPI0013E9D4A6|nr:MULTISPECIES: rhodanese-like domain-containing protein [unclassified Adlercreutzia]
MASKIVNADYVLENLDKIHIVDVRPIEMYENGHIPNAKSVPLMAAKEEGGDVAAIIEKSVEALGIKKDNPIIIYCHDGGLAHEACDLLESKGFTEVYCYEGSWINWIMDSSRPVER